MINIHMLMWGAKHVGPAQDLRMDADPATTWRNMAIAHARQVAKNHIRPDGSTYHIVEYNPFDGSVNRRYTYQVHLSRPGSSWLLQSHVLLRCTTLTQYVTHVQALQMHLHNSMECCLSHSC